MASALEIEMKMNEMNADDVRKAPGKWRRNAAARTFFDARAITNEKESSQRTQRTKLNSYTLTFDVAIFV